MINKKNNKSYVKKDIDSKINIMFRNKFPKSEFGGNESEFGKIWTKNHQKHPFLASKNDLCTF